PERDILGRQGVIGGSDEIFAIVLFRFTNRLLVDAKRSILQLTQVFSVGRMGTQPAGGLMMSFIGELAKPLQLLFQRFEQLFPFLALAFGFAGIVHENIALT